MKIYAMRHGVTKLNKLHFSNGQVDEDIIEEGIEQAKSSIDKVKDLDAEVIYCSPLLRAKHTCEIVNVNNLPVIYDDRLKERTMGVLDGTDINKYGITDDDYYNYYYENDAEGFETNKAFYERVHDFLDELKTKDYKSVLIVAHGGILRAIHFYSNPIPEDGNLLSAYNTSKNCQINTYEI